MSRRTSASGDLASRNCRTIVAELFLLLGEGEVHCRRVSLDRAGRSVRRPGRLGAMAATARGMPRCTTRTPRPRSTSSSWARATTTCSSCAARRPATPCSSTPPTSTSCLLELCQRLGVRRVLETHGHWDHIQAVPAAARRRLSTSASPPRTPAMLAAYDYVIEDDDGDRGRPAAAAHHPHPGPHARLDVLPARGLTRPVQRRHPVPRRPGQHRVPGRRLRPRSSSRSTAACSPCPADTLVLPGHGDDTTIGTERPHLQEWIDRGW